MSGGWAHRAPRAAKASCHLGVVATLVVALLTLTSVAAALPEEARPLTLVQAVEEAFTRYPTVTVALERADAARHVVNLARTSYLPRIDLLYQFNHATSNNVAGLLLPQAVLPAISGGTGTRSSHATEGSAAGMLAAWEPFDFGARRAGVAAAERSEARARAEVDLARLELATAVAEAFLATAIANVRVRSAFADVERREVLDRTVTVLVESELKPGADGSRVRAELATARTQLAAAEQADATALAALGALLARPGPSALDVAGLLAVSPDALRSPPQPGRHPALSVAQARVREAAARADRERRSWVPRVNVLGSVSARGSGARGDGTFDDPEGWKLDRTNWAAGVNVTFAVFDRAAIREREAIERATERAESAQQLRTELDLAGQIARAGATLDGAMRVADLTPAQLAAAQTIEEQARVRYDSGLGTIAEVADAQRLLVQAETDHAIARLSLWRALLGLAAARGDVSPFLELVRTARRR